MHQTLANNVIKLINSEHDHDTSLCDKLSGCYAQKYL